MTATLYVHGACQLPAGHQDAVQQLRAELALGDDGATFDLRTRRLALHIERAVDDATAGHCWATLERFVGAHAEHGAVFASSPCGRHYRAFGASRAEREGAERAYLVAQIRYWNRRLGDPPDLLRRLEPVPGATLPGDFSAAVRLVRRPYLPITREEYVAVTGLARQTDVLLLDGDTMVTYGTTDDGYALMPLTLPAAPSRPVPTGTRTGQRSRKRRGA